MKLQFVSTWFWELLLCIGKSGGHFTKFVQWPKSKQSLAKHKLEEANLTKI